MNPDPLRAEGTDWEREPVRLSSAPLSFGSIEALDMPWLLLAAVIVFVALGILVAVKR